MQKLHGLVANSNAEYHGGPGISKSHLDDIAPELGKTPLHYWAAHVDPDRTPPEDTDATRMGTAIHMALLEPDELSHAVVRGLDIARRSTADKYAWAEFEQANEGKIILRAEQYDRVVEIRDRVMAHPFLGPLLRHGRTEQSYYATDPETGLLTKCRPDYIAASGEFILDVKSTDSAAPGAFAKSVAKWRYDVQVPWYEDILDRLYGEHPRHWLFAAIEKEWPYACAVYYADNDLRAVGREKARRDLRLIAECHASGNWPDFATDYQRLRLPTWYIRKSQPE